jgi:hypothetical protein
MCQRHDNGAIVANWAEAIQLTTDPTYGSGYNANMKASLAFAEGSTDLIHTLMGTDPGYLAGDFSGYPWSPVGYAANLQIALSSVVPYATDQTRAQAALAKFNQWRRMDYSANPTFNTVPWTT